VGEAVEFVADETLRNRWLAIVEAAWNQMKDQYARTRAISLLTAPDLNRLVESCRLLGSVVVDETNHERPGGSAVRSLATACATWVTATRAAIRARIKGESLCVTNEEHALKVGAASP
jgi:hypothetical protein